MDLNQKLIFSPEEALKIAVSAAMSFRGATAPNPPVGAVALDSEGRLLSVQAHEKAGTGHAEAKVLQECRAKGLLNRIDTLVITLEPCNHHGRTPPCTESILSAFKEGTLRKVYFGTTDPNPKVAGNGAARLRAAGLEVHNLKDVESEKLIEAFSYWIQTGRPFVTLKMAFDNAGSMIPPIGQKTFSNPEALKFAHELRKQSDAILTGSGTVLADLPEFTVRHVKDHSNKMRWLAVLDRRGRVPTSWIAEREKVGFKYYRGESVEETLKFLGEQGVLEVLVEAGPAISQLFLDNNLWNRKVLITPDGIEIQYRE
jgi:diaminohydroxyphosphoribosylaminopyrimidine deaminase/5-amino-6-(5-phosphoribosylamino)uracil reductase